MDQETKQPSGILGIKRGERGSVESPKIEPKNDQVLPGQEKIIDSIVEQIKHIVRNVLMQVAHGEINAEEGKKKVMEQVEAALDTPFQNLK